ncbi:TIGR02300 family protein [Mesorhizobium xinjiangense]|uniref:TIGR02300 family protein n=1 Tax=Mesorhizobium xinjiangense TaxID=2678685 RepID=UPI0012EEDD2E|nr:TIGR02300 family protein [Mesorhizobium xinjiangense]
MARQELGTKRVCPETGRKFYDLNKDPIVSPYTGVSYPRSYFEAGSETIVEEEEVETTEIDSEGASAEIVSLEEADEEAKGGSDADDDDDDDVDLGDDDNTFLESDEEGSDDVADIIGVGDDDEEER